MDGLNYGVFPENQRGKSQAVRHEMQSSGQAVSVWPNSFSGLR